LARGIAADVPGSTIGRSHGRRRKISWVPSPCARHEDSRPPPARPQSRLPDRPQSRSPNRPRRHQRRHQAGRRVDGDAPQVHALPTISGHALPTVPGHALPTVPGHALPTVPGHAFSASTVTRALKLGISQRCCNVDAFGSARPLDLIAQGLARRRLRKSGIVAG
jgi:hypothetical protein